MRIKFNPIKPVDEFQLIDLTREYDIIQQVYPSLNMSFDNLHVSDIQSYTDNAKYNLNLFEVDFNRLYANQSFLHDEQNHNKGGKIQVFELELLFNMDISFRLFQDNYVDYWENDINIAQIKPLVTVYGNMDIAYFAFHSLASSYFVEMLDTLKSNNHIMCVKRGNKLIFAYAVEDQYTYWKRNDLLESFLDAIYEMVKVTSGRGNYLTPDDQLKKTVDVNQWYTDRRNHKNNNPKRVISRANDDFY